MTTPEIPDPYNAVPLEALGTLLVCTLCGVVVPEGFEELHREAHEQADDRKESQ